MPTDAQAATSTAQPCQEVCMRLGKELSTGIAHDEDERAVIGTDAARVLDPPEGVDPAVTETTRISAEIEAPTPVMS
jgi:hypothetical protein